LLRQPLSIKKSSAGTAQVLSSEMLLAENMFIRKLFIKEALRFSEKSCGSL
jgi:hypothetical protein